MVLLTNDSVVKSYDSLCSSKKEIEEERKYAESLKNKLEKFRDSLNESTMRKLESLYEIKESVLDGQLPTVITELRDYEEIIKLNIYSSALNIARETQEKAIILCSRRGNMSSLNIVGINHDQSSCFPIFDFKVNNGDIKVSLYKQAQDKELKDAYLSEMTEISQCRSCTEEEKVRLKSAIEELKSPTEEEILKHNAEVQQQFYQSFIDFHGITDDTSYYERANFTQYKKLIQGKLMISDFTQYKKSLIQGKLMISDLAGLSPLETKVYESQASQSQPKVTVYAKTII